MTEEKKPEKEIKENIDKAKASKKEKKPKQPSKEDQIADLTDSLQHLQAEFENYKKRVDKETAQFRQFAEAGLIEELLPILDSLELALKQSKDDENFKKGVELIYSQLYQLLEKKGLKPIDTTNQKFDPYKHEVLLQEESEKDQGTILEELQKGYYLKDKILRHTKVKIAKKKGG